jgi:predicted nucleic acid-binding protein
MKTHVLDASALLAMLFGESGVEEMRGLFHRAAAEDRPLLISAVNWAETLYCVARREGDAGLATVRLLAASGALSVIPADAELAELAAAYKAADLLGLADAFAAALAQQRKAELVTSDYDFKSVEREIKLVWLRPRVGHPPK